MRLIDADALRNAMFNNVFLQDTEMQKWDSGCWIRYKLFENCLEAAPTVDAVPVKHGRWVRHYSRPGVYADLLWYCSVCSKPCGYSNAYMFVCCPYCGAKMDLKGEDDEVN